MAQTSDRVSSLAARYINYSLPVPLKSISVEQQLRLERDIRSMAASLMRQDEHKGLRAKIRRVLGRG